MANGTFPCQKHWTKQEETLSVQKVSYNPNLRSKTRRIIVENGKVQRERKVRLDQLCRVVENINYWVQEKSETLKATFGFDIDSAKYRMERTGRSVSADELRLEFTRHTGLYDTIRAYDKEYSKQVLSMGELLATVDLNKEEFEALCKASGSRPAVHTHNPSHTSWKTIGTHSIYAGWKTYKRDIDHGPRLPDNLVDIAVWAATRGEDPVECTHNVLNSIWDLHMQRRCAEALAWDGWSGSREDLSKKRWLRATLKENVGIASQWRGNSLLKRDMNILNKVQGYFEDLYTDRHPACKSVQKVPGLWEWMAYNAESVRTTYRPSPIPEGPMRTAAEQRIIESTDAVFETSVRWQSLSEDVSYKMVSAGGACHVFLETKDLIEDRRVRQSIWSGTIEDASNIPMMVWETLFNRRGASHFTEHVTLSYAKAWEATYGDRVANAGYDVDLSSDLPLSTVYHNADSVSGFKQLIQDGRITYRTGRYIEDRQSGIRHKVREKGNRITVNGVLFNKGNLFNKSVSWWSMLLKTLNHAIESSLYKKGTDSVSELNPTPHRIEYRNNLYDLSVPIKRSGDNLRGIRLQSYGTAGPANLLFT